MNEANKSPFIPLLILGLAVVIWFGFQAAELYQERGRLLAARAAQEETLVKAQKMRGQLDVIAAGAQKLADQGNPGAISVINALRARGITINPAAAGSEGQPSGVLPK